jgi:glutathione S-transferase
MQLYFSPLACSMATRIALYEAGAEAEFVQVDGKTKLTSAQQSYLAINPLGLVPALALDSGEVLTENAAILQYVAARFPDARLAPSEGIGRARLQQWLCFIGTELHKAVFGPLLDRKASEAVRAYALELSTPRLALLERHLTGREFLLESFSVADAYLVTVLGWSQATAIALAKWPVLDAYVARLRTRPSVARALAEEFALYRKDTAPSAAAAAALSRAARR